MKLIIACLLIISLALVLAVFKMQSSNAQLRIALDHMRVEALHVEQRLQQLRNLHKGKMDKLKRELLSQSKESNFNKAPVNPTQTSDLDRSGALVLEALRRDQMTRSVDEKYSLLIAALELSPSEGEKLKEMLIQRQQILNSPLASYYTKPEDIEVAVDQQQLFLQELDKHVATLLSTENYQIYNMVKESDFEQYQLKQFDNVLEDAEKLTGRQRNELLLAKLKNKQLYERALSQVQAMVAVGEADKAATLIAEALDNYQERYLLQAQQLVNDVQYGKLQAYEQKHFKQMLDSLDAQQLDRQQGH